MGIIMHRKQKKSLFLSILLSVFFLAVSSVCPVFCADADVSGQNAGAEAHEVSGAAPEDAAEHAGRLAREREAVAGPAPGHLHAAQARGRRVPRSEHVRRARCIAHPTGRPMARGCQQPARSPRRGALRRKKRELVVEDRTLYGVLA